VGAQLVAYLGFGAASLVLLTRSGYLRWEFDRALCRDALHYGAPLVPHVLGGIAITMTDRALIKNLVGLDAAGVYAAAAQIGLGIGVLQDGFHKGWLPWFFAQLGRGDTEQDRRLVKLIYAYDVGILVLAAAVGLAAPPLFAVLVGDAFHGGGECVLWLAFGWAFNGMYKMRSGYLLYQGKTHLLAAVTALAAVVNVGASWLLIRHHGFVGAAQGTMLAFFVGFVATWLLSSRVHHVPWRLRTAV
jgi:O-antigen/teichoic acid export membrane protein